MSLIEEISQQKLQAMKGKEAETLGTLRILWSALQDEKREKGDELTDDDILAIVMRQVKQLQDAMKQFSDAGRDDLAEKNATELEVLKQFMPEQLSEEDIKSIITETIAEVGEGANMGQVMGKVMQKVKGKADGNTVRALLQDALK